MPRVSLDLSADTLAALNKTPDEFLSEMRLAAAVKWYEIGIVSQGKAAEIAGLSRADFVSALGRFRVSALQYTDAELLSDEKFRSGADRAFATHGKALKRLAK
jgi:predicted HTH domain antitoxin